jgi:transcriptional regulator with XRE-family HTH domain
MESGMVAGVIRPQEAGAMLRAWRNRRRLSQLALALDAGVSARHLSFVETGRSRPSAELLLSLAERLQLPLRSRNELLLAAGFAPRFSETGLSSPDLASVRGALRRLLDAHDPWPGVALDRQWNVVLANAAALRLASALPPFLREPQINMFRASLHPQGFAAFTANFDEWGRYLFGELRRLAESDADASALLDEVGGYQNVRALREHPSVHADGAASLLVPCVLDVGGRRLRLFTTLAVFGSPRDVTLAELTVELFYPADEATASALRGEQGHGTPS